MKQPKWKRILTLVLVVVLAAGAVAGYFAMTYQKAPQVLDRTEGKVTAQKEEKKDSGSGGKKDGDFPEEMALNPSVATFDKKENDKINDAILELKSIATGVEMEIENGTAMDELGVGDIFFLGGDKETPFGMTYIGKISAVMPGEESTTYMLKTPGIDEVFDVLRFSEEGILKPENLVEVDCVPGVTLASESQQASNLTQTGQSSYAVVPLSSNGGGQVVNLAKVSGGTTDELLFNVEVDLLELLGIDKEPESKQEQVDFMGAGSVTVYVTKNGNHYHKEKCGYLKASCIQTNLEQALHDGKKPCSRCKPPLRKDDEGVVDADTNLTLSGHFGLKDVTYSATCNWDILNGGGLEDLYFDVTGTVSAGVKLEGNFELEIGGRTTQVVLLEDKMVFEGMKEHLIPLAAVHYAVGATFQPVAGMGEAANKNIRLYTSAVPMSVIGLVYVDMQGKLTAGFNAYFNYERTFTYQKDIVRAGKFTYDKSFDPGKAKIETGINAEVTADLDAHLGAGLDLYLFNLKVAQLDVIKVGVEAAGEVRLQYTNGVANGEEEAFEWKAWVRGYLKMLELKLGIQAKEEVIPLVDLSFSVDYDLCLWDHTLFKYGDPTGTRYDPNTMSYTHTTAKDSTANYYKDTDGQLMKVQNGEKTVLHAEEFFTICGIDETYIYILEECGSSTHSIRRIAKDGATSKIVAEDVKQFLTMDEENAYFVSSFDGSVIKKLDRSSCDITNFANYDNSVIRMSQQGENFYVAVGRGSTFGFSGDYILVDKDGNTIANYGGNPPVENLERVEFQDYHVAKKVSSSGYLRDTAEAIYWVGADGSNKRISAVTGWNYYEGGVITMEHASSGYNIVLYRAGDGAKVTLGAAKHSHALFTTAQDETGRWYYVDQTSENVTLYTVSADLSSRREMYSVPRSQFPVDLSKCSVNLVDGKLYFYTITNNHTCDVLYIFNLY